MPRPNDNGELNRSSTSALHRRPTGVVSEAIHKMLIALTFFVHRICKKVTIFTNYKPPIPESALHLHGDNTLYCIAKTMQMQRTLGNKGPRKTQKSRPRILGYGLNNENSLPLGNVKELDRIEKVSLYSGLSGFGGTPPLRGSDSV